ncbi:MAG: biotin--[acetyl-CoA-carboxylase] ligase [Solirubrobacterales bacterium]|nr:biotin--[acetyl-CoA-carboxylase] ligase [Solirubrobacterales bacterium]MBV9164805.1 biotin--[acetyl-CoA-carboxylase] ligase [Solirubrobacterales bacterium]MBV9536268.1 biotin--[acetyl-CoA-carboxylase] ligase [Solirubrobacterales bacterium]
MTPLDAPGWGAAPDSRRAIGFPRVHYRTVDSTNERARLLAMAGAPDGTLVTAEEQRAGRGRQGRSWSAPRGRALLCSLVVREPPRFLPLAAGVAVASVAGGEAGLKWPNDVLMDGRKVAGILVEGRPQERWAVLGIGVNVAVSTSDLPSEVRARAATLGLSIEDIEPWLARLLAALRHWLAAGEAEVLDAVRARDALLGRPVRWAGGGGTGAGIDGDGRLVVATAEGRVALDSGEVHLG